MESNLNGICMDGKFYEAVETDLQICCECDLYDSCMGLNADTEMRMALLCVCHYFNKDNIFRYSPELTEKLNKQ